MRRWSPPWLWFRSCLLDAGHQWRIPLEQHGMLLPLAYNSLLPQMPPCKQWGMKKLCRNSNIVGFTLSFAEEGTGEGERSFAAMSFWVHLPMPAGCGVRGSEPSLHPPSSNRFWCIIYYLTQLLLGGRTWRWGRFVDRDLRAVCDKVYAMVFFCKKKPYGFLLKQEGVKLSMQLIHGRI